MDALGGIPIRRDRRDLLSVVRAADLLRAGETVALFPQGTIQEAPGRAAPRLALTTGAPLVPFGSSARGRALSHGRIAFPKIRIVVCEPIPVARAKPTVAEARRLTELVQARVDAAR